MSYPLKKIGSGKTIIWFWWQTSDTDTYWLVARDQLAL
jgi:hypothetical protein